MKPSGKLSCAVVAGVTAMDRKLAAVTVSIVLPEIGPLVVTRVAVMVEVPTPTPNASPLFSKLLLTVAALMLDDDHDTWVVRSWVVRSEYVPVAVNRPEVPFGVLGAAGVTAMDCKMAGVTVNVVFALKLPNAAAMIAVPTKFPVAKPLEPAELLMGAIGRPVAGSVPADDHVTWVVRFWVVWSE